MILSKDNTLVFHKKGGEIIFHSDQVDLDKDSLVMPSKMKDGSLSTVEYTRNTITLHPANDVSTVIGCKAYFLICQEIGSV